MRSVSRFIAIGIMLGMLTNTAWGGAFTADEEIGKWLVVQARLAQQQLIRHDRLLQAPDMQAYLTRIARRLMAHSANGLPPSLDIKILLDDAPNAFAYPDGTIYLHSGLLIKLQTEAQAAMLLAHEMAHLTQQHTLQTLQLVQSLAGVGQLEPHGWSISANGPVQSHQLRKTITRFTDRAELEADRLGFQMMHRAGYDPHQALLLLDITHEGMVAQNADTADSLRPEHGHLQQPWLALLALGAPLDESSKDPPAAVTKESRTLLGLAERRAQLAQFFTLLPSRLAQVEITDSHAFRLRMAPIFIAHGRYALQLGNFDLAFECADTYLALFPAAAEGHYLLGETFRQRDHEGDSMAAVKAYYRTLEKNNQHAGAHRCLGLWWFKQQKFENARKHLRKAVRLAPAYPGNEHLGRYLALCNS